MKNEPCLNSYVDNATPEADIDDDLFKQGGENEYQLDDENEPEDEDEDMDDDEDEN